MIRKIWALSFVVFLFQSFPGFGQQLWTGILAPSRAVSWQSAAGFPGNALPDASWTQCGSTIAAGASAATINSALAACGSNQYVLLGAGTFNLTAPIIVSDYSSLKSNVALRGSGANSTLLVYSGSAAGAAGGCFSDVVSLEGGCAYVNGGEGNVCTFAGASTTSTITAGTYQQGATYLSITNCGGTTPATGSLSNLKVGGIIMVDQADLPADNGTLWPCAITVVSGLGGCAGNGDGGGMRTNGPCATASGVTTCERSQVQGFVVVGISGSVVQVDEPLYLSNWSTAQTPQAWFPSSTATNVGLENLSVDTTAASGFVSTINILACNKCWVSGVKSVDSNRSHIRMLFSTHDVITSNYMYKNQTGSTSSYGFEIAGGWYNLLENNITQQITDSDPSCTAPCAGNVIDYNFDVDNAFTAGPGYIVPPLFLHAGGDVMNLWEGNVGPGFSGDNIHGTHHFETVNRNLLTGWQSNCSGPCIAQTIPIMLPAGTRYINVVGNVLGEPGFHTGYQCAAQTSNSLSNCPTAYSTNGVADKEIYLFNYVQNTYVVTYSFCNSLPAGSCTSVGGWDTQPLAYSLRWGNYDTVTGAARYCGNSADSGWATTCSSTSEIPTSLSSYANSVPTYGDTAIGQSAMPASFFYATEPSFLGSAPWPLEGPDVTGGTLGVCSGGSYSGMAALSSAQCSGGTLTSAWAGHANANAAMACYLNTMGGPPDGTGSVLSFNASSCYGGGTKTSNQPGAATNLTATPITH
jgi:hypothetical protein